MRNNNRAHIALLVTTLIFGMHYAIAKALMPVMMLPMQLLFMRSLGGLILFWLFQTMFVREKVERRDLLMLAVCGLFGFALNQALFYEGLNLTTPVDASIIHVLNPVFVLVFASILIKEKVNLTKVSGIGLGLAGALILILYGKTMNMGIDSFRGNILVMLNMLFYAFYIVLMKPIVAKYHTATILKWVSFFGFIFIVPFSIPSLLVFHPSTITLAGWLGVAYVIILNTFVAYLLINFALKYVEASMVSFYTYLQPVIASVMSVSMGGETITLPKILAAMLIFAGVWMVNRNKKTLAEVR
ncbi:MAG TPA: DMT family transporter [Bacteroidales bacterium]|nr:DMT family transporter [Bacteroidales bacterium]